MSRNGIKLAGADDNLIQANLIGTDASGTRACPTSATACSSAAPTTRSAEQQTTIAT